MKASRNGAGSTAKPILRPGRERLAERAAIDHPPGAIERRERRQRLAVPAELGIGVVLHHPGAGARRPVEQSEAAADRQGTAHRGGVRGGHEHQPRLGRDPHARRDVHAVDIRRHRHGHGAGGEQGAAAGDVAGVLHPGALAGIEQQVGGDAERLLRAGGDDDELRVGHQPAGGSEVERDRLAEGRQALRVRIAGLLHRAPAARGPRIAPRRAWGRARGRECRGRAARPGPALRP